MRKTWARLLMLALCSFQTPLQAETGGCGMEAVVDFRVARPSNDLARLRQFYVDGLSLEVLAEFVGHEGFDGLILSLPDGHTQIEFTKAAGHVAPRAPTEDHLLVFYIDSVSAHTAAVLRMQAHGFEPVRSFNPYWDRHGVTFEDPEGYRVVIVRGAYPLTEPAGD